MTDEKPDAPQRSASKPPKGRPFVSGDPRQNRGGRPKMTEEAKEAKAKAQAIIDAATPDAARAAVKMLGHKDFRARHAAGSSLLDRAGLKGVLEVRLLMGQEVEKLTERLKAAFGAEPELLLRILAVVLEVNPDDADS